MENGYVKLVPREIRDAAWPEARFLSEEEQARYEDAIKQFSGIAYDSLDISKNGSNLFKVLLLNQIGIPTATLPQLEDALDNGMQLKGHYEDSPSVVLRSNGDSYEDNDYLAKSLAKVVGKRTFNHSLILNGLELKADNDSAYGLALVPGEKFVKIEAPDLDHKNNGRKFTRINPDYTVEWSDQGERTFYTKDQGLSRLYLSRYLNVYSNDDRLALSIDGGRVVLVSAEGASREILDQYLSNLRAEREKQIAEVESRFNNAMSVLKTGKR